MRELDLFSLLLGVPVGWFIYWLVIVLFGRDGVVTQWWRKCTSF